MFSSTQMHLLLMAARLTIANEVTLVVLVHIATPVRTHICKSKRGEPKMHQSI